VADLYRSAKSANCIIWCSYHFWHGAYEAFFGCFFGETVVLRKAAKKTPKVVRKLRLERFSDAERSEA
jgi:hypothetical protein